MSTQDPDPAASMSLLTDLLKNPLDAGYTRYIDAEHTSKSRWWQKILVLLLACALGVGSVAAVRALRMDNRLDVTRSELLKQVALHRQTVTELENENNDLTSSIAKATSQSQSDLSLDPTLALANSLDAVSGPGVKVTLKDAADSSNEHRNSGTVRDQDLNMVVNALWSAQAEAISINNIRVGPGTFIRTAGSVILVDVTPIQSPYIVQAIGDGNALSVALVKGTTGDYLSSVQSVNGIHISTAGVHEISMPRRDMRTTRYASPTPTDEGK